jgi:hypothetical protein
MSEAEAGEHLRELCGMPEGVGGVGDACDRAERLADAPSLREVPDVRLPARDQRIRLHVPRPDLDPSGLDVRFELGPAVRPDRDVVLEDDRLSVQQEGVLGVRRHHVEHLVHGVDEARTEGLERAVPLAVPVGRRNEDDVHQFVHGPVETRLPSCAAATRGATSSEVSA